MAKNKNQIYFIIFAIVLLFLGGQMCMAYGKLKERQNSVCATPFEIEQWKKTIDMARSVYLNTADSYGKDIEKARAEAQRWRDSYFQLKNQAEAEKDIITLNN